MGVVDSLGRSRKRLPRGNAFGRGSGWSMAPPRVARSGATGGRYDSAFSIRYPSARIALSVSMAVLRSYSFSDSGSSS